MTRASVLVGLLLGVVSILGGVLGYAKGSAASLYAGVGSGVLLLAFGWLTLRGMRWAHAVVLLVALGLLGRFLPAYFQEPRVWPSLTLIALAAVTFGLGVLGFVLDRYRGGPRGGL